VIIAGIIIFADGAKLTVEQSAQAPMPDAGRLALCGGVALYLVGLAAFRLRIAGDKSPGRLVIAAALMALYALGGSIPAWSVAAGISVLIGVLCIGEALTERGEEA
jgi:low temperature requirement protein LtrA